MHYWRESIVLVKSYEITLDEADWLKPFKLTNYKAYTTRDLLQFESSA